MATLTNPNQGYSFSIPDLGEVFLGGGWDSNIVLKRTSSGDIIAIKKSDYGDTSGLKSYNFADIISAFPQSTVGKQQTIGGYDLPFADKSQFTNQPTSGGGDINVAVDPQLQAFLAGGGFQNPSNTAGGIVPQGTPAPLPTGSVQQTTSILPPAVSLQPGQTGPEVEKLQKYLVANGYMTQAEMDTGPGIYGRKTKTAVEQLQKTLNVPNSTGPGFYGPRTISAIQAIPPSPSTSDGFIGYVNGKVQTFPTKEAAQQAGATGIEPNYKRNIPEAPTGAGGTKGSPTNPAGNTKLPDTPTQEDVDFEKMINASNLPEDMKAMAKAVFSAVSTNNLDYANRLVKAFKKPQLMPTPTGKLKSL